MLVRKAFPVLAVGTTTALMTAAPAFAEGSFKTSMSGFHIGDASRTWQDRNTDSTNGYVYLRSCNQASVHIDVVRERIGPDQTIKTGRINCSTGGYISFGDVSAGNYHFDVYLINDSAANPIRTVSSSSVTVKY